MELVIVAVVIAIFGTLAVNYAVRGSKKPKVH